MLVSIPALNDNYIWLYTRDNSSVIVIDVPETKNLMTFLTEHQLNIAAVLLTHHHDDHTAGVNALCEKFPHLTVIGSPETQSKGANHIIEQGEFMLKDYHVEAIPTGGHTAHHLSYLIDGQYLFSGDCLFSAGCGRVFTGDYEQMYQSLQRLKQLPDDTIVCPAHEYTLSNLDFALTVLKDKTAAEIHLQQVHQKRQANQPSLPTTLALERRINPFLQAKNLDEFIQLRQAKDNY